MVETLEKVPNKLIPNFKIESVPEVRVKSISLKNFKTFENYTFDFSSKEEIKKFICLIGPNGYGKCFSKNTPVLMYDGTIKFVEDIIVGDIVMGNDSTPRRVVGTHSGKSELFKIIPSKGDPYIVNGNHTLVLKITGNNKRNEYKQYENSNGMIEIEVNDFIKKSKSFKHLMVGIRSGVKFSQQTVKIDPYILGTWLGDGSSDSPYITTEDDLIAKKWEEESERRGLNFVSLEKDGTDAKRFGIIGQKGKLNSLTEDLRSYGLINNKHIPNEYKANSEEIRLKLLAGIIDTDGSLMKNTVFDYISVSSRLAEDVLYLSRSLGFQAYIKECEKGCQTGVIGTYYRVCISGDTNRIPTILPHKKANKRRINKNHLHVGIKIEPYGTGEYYGFQTDGNGLFLLGDFTVVHNSTVLSAIQLLFSNLNFRTKESKDAFLGKSVRHIGKEMDGIYGDSDFEVSAKLVSEKEEYEIVINKSGFVKDHPKEIKELAYRICYLARFDQELSKFQISRDKWGLFKELFESVTGFEIEEDKEVNTFFADSSDSNMKRLMDEYVLAFYVKKPMGIIQHKECSDGEKKIIKAFSTILTLEYTPKIILIDNVEMHVERGRHLKLIDSLKKCFPDSQIFTTTHSYYISRGFGIKDCVYDLRLISANNIIKNEPWRLCIIDEITEALIRVEAIDENNKLVTEGKNLLNSCSLKINDLQKFKKNIEKFLKDCSTLFLKSMFLRINS